MKQYESYKDSGIQWLGQIPSHWRHISFKRLFSFGRGLSITKSDLVEEGIPVISYGQIHSKQNTGTKVEQHLLRYVPESYIDDNDSSKVNKGDFIFADTSEDLEGCGNCVYIDNDNLLYAGYHSIIARSIQSNDNKYLAYLFKTDCWRSQIRSTVYGVKVFSVTQSTLSDTTVILPSVEEQMQIASYLDHKVSQIDSAIAEKEQMLEDLKAYRSAMISEAVNKGLNKDVEMKDSGIDWIGEIPENWNTIKLSRVYPNIGSGTTPDTNNSQYYSEEGINWLQTGDLNDGDIYETSKHITELALKEKGLRIYPKGSLVIAMYGATIGKVGLLQIETTTNQACCVLPPNEKMSIIYTKFVLQAAKDVLLKQSVGGGQPNISQSIIRSLSIPMPPLEEQIKIAEKIQNTYQNIEKTLNELLLGIDDLKAYKSSIITEAVTGKVDLRDWKPKLVNP